MKIDRNGYYKISQVGKLWPCRDCYFEEISGHCLSKIVQKGIYDELGSCNDGTIYKKLISDENLGRTS